MNLYRPQKHDLIAKIIHALGIAKKWCEFLIELQNVKKRNADFLLWFLCSE